MSRNFKVVYLAVIAQDVVLPIGENKYYLYYRGDSNLYLYDSLREAEWNLFDLDVPMKGNIKFNITKTNKGSINFFITKSQRISSQGTINFNITKSDKGNINFSIAKINKGNINFAITKSLATGTLVVNVKEVVI